MEKLRLHCIFARTSFETALRAAAKMSEFRRTEHAFIHT
jgi:hypothetical protein